MPFPHLTTGSAPEGLNSRHAAWEELLATATPRQRELLFAFESEHSTSLLAEQDALTEELARHFPGLAPAIRSVVQHHLIDQRRDDVGTCCAD